MWLSKVAGLNPATSAVILAWDRAGRGDFELRADCSKPVWMRTPPRRIRSLRCAEPTRRLLDISALTRRDEYASHVRPRALSDARADGPSIARTTEPSTTPPRLAGNWLGRLLPRFAWSAASGAPLARPSRVRAGSGCARCTAVLVGGFPLARCDRARARRRDLAAHARRARRTGTGAVEYLPDVPRGRGAAGTRAGRGGVDRRGAAPGRAWRGTRFDAGRASKSTRWNCSAFRRSGGWSVRGCWRACSRCRCLHVLIAATALGSGFVAESADRFDHLSEVQHRGAARTGAGRRDPRRAEDAGVRAGRRGCRVLHRPERAAKARRASAAPRPTASSRARFWCSRRDVLLVLAIKAGQQVF